VRNRYVLAADLLLMGVAAFGAFALRFDWFAWSYRGELIPFVLAALLIKPVVFHAFGMYQRYWAYASVQDMLAVFFATSAASVGMTILVAIGLLTHQLPEFSRSVLIIDWSLTLLMAGGLRMSVRIISDAHTAIGSRTSTERPPRRVLLIGAGQAGAIVVREMQKNPQLGMVPVGFLDDDRAKVGKRIHGLAVLANVARLEHVVHTAGVDEVIIAMPKAGGTVLRAIAERCRLLGVTSRTVPGMFELIDGKLGVSRLRNVEIVDLLQRPHMIRSTGSSRYLAGETVLVTGAGGSIGLELCRQVAHAGPALLVILGHGENSIYEANRQLAMAFPSVRVQPVIADVRDAERLQGVFRTFRPGVVFHAAAHKHVPLMEDNPEEAVSNNVIGTRNVVDAAVACGTPRLVLVSTDKAVSPTSIMGASKRIAEEVVRSAARRHGRSFVVVRFGNVLGSRGSVVPLFKQQIERGGPITITHPDMRRFFMTIPEAVDLVLQAGGMGNGGELFVLNMGEPVRIVDLATDLIKLSGLSPEEIPIEFSGLRAGEKLSESLWEDGAIVQPTANPDVLQVAEPQGPPGELAHAIDDLVEAARLGDRLRLAHAFAQRIPSFAPLPDPRAMAARPPVA
jgi:FlaA1/EpsC-like NDP-sugar epimerase